MFTLFYQEINMFASLVFFSLLNGSGVRQLGPHEGVVPPKAQLFDREAYLRQALDRSRKAITLLEENVRGLERFLELSAPDLNPQQVKELRNDLLKLQAQLDEAKMHRKKLLEQEAGKARPVAPMPRQKKRID
jgi:hypothetical protein